MQRQNSVDMRRVATYVLRRRVRVFTFQTGKLRRTYDESLAAANELQRGESEVYNLEPIDFGRRMAGEKDLLADPEAPEPNAIFDESGNFIIYATLLGIKVLVAVDSRRYTICVTGKLSLAPSESLVNSSAGLCVLGEL